MYFIRQLYCSSLALIPTKLRFIISYAIRSSINCIDFIPWSGRLTRVNCPAVCLLDGDSRVYKERKGPGLRERKKTSRYVAEEQNAGAIKYVVRFKAPLIATIRYSMLQPLVLVTVSGSCDFADMPIRKAIEREKENTNALAQNYQNKRDNE